VAEKSLESIFEDFFRPEEIAGFECDMCKSKNCKVEKSSELWVLPKVLIINFARFVYSVSQQNFTKKNDKIKIPENISLDDMQTKGKTRYNLHAIVNHSGTVDIGHYTT
jgi:ubiquitin C-terminal hydrolase